MKDVFYHRVIDFERRIVYVVPVYKDRMGYFCFGYGREYIF